MMDDHEPADSEIRTAIVPPDPTPSDVLAARAEKALRESPPPASIGRFTVIRTIGRGGMGIVFAAYDERLDRKLAIKLLRMHHREGSEGRARILREAQAMAKLSHPNVAQIYEVGEHDGGVFVAMEFVEGGSLRQWLEGARSREEILAVLIGAGRGLAAAHARGIVHRDFKPDNVLVGTDGRSRVVDFGLARAAATVDSDRTPGEDPGDDLLATDITMDGSVVGTPAYMSPQQHVGEPADPRSDQFSFCVTAFEALYGARPFRGNNRAELAGAATNNVIVDPASGPAVPAWIRRVILRGLEPEPEQRWPSMEVLLAALAADPSRKRRRWLGFAGVAAVSLVAGAVVMGGRDAQPQVCTGAPERLAGVWDDSTKASAAGAFSQLQSSYAGEVWPRVEAVLDEYAGEWTGMHRSACLAHDRGEESDTRFDLRMRCLDQRLEEMQALVEVLGEADSKTAERAIQAAHGLRALGACDDPDRLAELAPIPEELAGAAEQLRAGLVRSTALAQAGRFEESLAVAREHDASAAELDFLPLRAEAHYTLARALQRMGDAKAAEPKLEACLNDALTSRADTLASQCATQLVYTVGEKLGRYSDAMRWAGIARALIDRGAGDELSAARLSMQTGNVLRSKGDYDLALEHQLEAVERFERVMGPDHLEVGVARNNLGGVQWRMGDLSGARRNLEAGLRIRKQVLGPRHPQVASSLNNLGIVLASEGRFEDALTKHDEALLLKRELLGRSHPSVAYSLHNLGDTLHRLGRFEDAQARLAEALAMREELLGENHPSVLDTLASLGAVRVDAGEFGAALEPLERAVAVATEKLDEAHPDLADPLTALGRARLGLEEPQKALPLLERALAIRLANDSEPGPRGETRLAVARALVESGGDLERARELATTARAELDAAGRGFERSLAAAESWLAEH